MFAGHLTMNWDVGLSGDNEVNFSSDKEIGWSLDKELGC